MVNITISSSSISWLITRGWVGDMSSSSSPPSNRTFHRRCGKCRSRFSTTTVTQRACTKCDTSAVNEVTQSLVDRLLIQPKRTTPDNGGGGGGERPTSRARITVPVDPVALSTFMGYANVDEILWKAVSNDKSDVISFVLEHGGEHVDVNYVHNDESILNIAIVNGYTSSVRALLSSSPQRLRIDVENRDNEDVITPLLLAIKSGHVGVVRILLDNGRVRTGPVKLPDFMWSMIADHATTPFHFAMRHDKLKVAELLMEKNLANPNAMYTQKLYKAEGYIDPHTWRDTIEFGLIRSPPYWPSDTRVTLLTHAWLYMRPRFMELLLKDPNADPNIKMMKHIEKEEGIPLLNILVEFLMRIGDEKDQRTKEHRELYQKITIDAMNVLLRDPRTNPNISAGGSFSGTPLTALVISKRMDLVPLLLKYPSVQVDAPHWRSPLHWLVVTNKGNDLDELRENVDLLLRHGADPDAREDPAYFPNNNTVIHSLVESAVWNNSEQLKKMYNPELTPMENKALYMRAMTKKAFRDLETYKLIFWNMLKHGSDPAQRISRPGMPGGYETLVDYMERSGVLYWYHDYYAPGGPGYEETHRDWKSYFETRVAKRIA